MIISRFYSFLRSYLLILHINRRFLVILFPLLFLSSLAHGAYTPFNTNVSGNIGVGTSSPLAKFVVFQGNVGVNTFTAGNNLSVLGGVGIGSATYANTLAPVNGIIVSGNVGIGSLAPGQSLDVNGTVRMTGLTVNGAGAAAGYVLTATDSTGDTIWSTVGNVSGWTLTNTNDVYQTHNGNVGIGTTITNRAALTVMNGNVGIGTWVPGGALIVQGGNVGVGSTNPGQAVDVQGTIRATFFQGNGSLLTGLTSSQWLTTNTNDVYLPNGGNVGLGTTITNSAALSVMNGNVGIGTWVPGSPLVVSSEAIGTNSLYTSVNTAPANGLIVQGFVGIGTWSSTSFALQVNGTAYANYLGTATGVDVAGGNIIFPATTSIIQFYNGSGSADTAIKRNAPGVLEVDNGTAGSLAKLIASNVGIGTPNPLGGGLIVLPANSGNVGIGSLTPGQALDVTGTIRTTGLTMSGAGPAIGYVLTATDSAGDTTWSTAGGVSGWTITNTNDVYETHNGNVGIGTTMTTTSALTVMNGNVGIGTWVPGYALEVDQPGNNAFYINQGGGTRNFIFNNQGITTNTTLSVSGAGAGTADLAVHSGTQGRITVNVVGSSLQTADMLDIANFGGTNGNLFNVSAAGNVGIGSLTPGQTVDVQGTVRMTGLTMSGAGPAIGYVLTATDSAGDTTWSTAPSVAGWAITNTNDVYKTNNGNVGIGTTLTSTAALTVMNGNVGIGTWTPSESRDRLKVLETLTERNGGLTTNSGGNVDNRSRLNLTGLNGAGAMGNGSRRTNVAIFYFR